MQRAAVAQNSPELSRLIAEKDWAQTPLGPVAQWPLTLRSLVEQILGSGFGYLLWWGPQHVQIYNDAYRPILGAKHPYALGMRGAECWSEIWDIIGPMVERPFHGGEPSTTEDLELVINRHGYPEETHFTVSYSPVFDDAMPNGIGGVLATVQETTAQVIASRRMELLRDLGTLTAGATDAHEAVFRAAQGLSSDPKDVSYALMYLLDHEKGSADVAGRFGVRPSRETLSIAELEHVAGINVKKLRRATRTHVTLPELTAANNVVVPLAFAVDGKANALLIAGANPNHAFDESYRAFFDVLAAPISAAILNAKAYEAEAQRAKALEELDSAKNEFFSNVSHEFRTPLTLMLGPLAELAQTGDENARDLAEKARRNSLRLLKLVNTLLEFSRLQAGRSDAAFAETDLALFTRHLIGSFGSAFESAELQLETDIDLQKQVYVDRSMWERIVLNLISNAIKFTLQGEVTVSLHAAGDCAELVVKDTGVGIPADEMPHVFERFRRIRNAASRSHEGSGIGLALVKDLVELHGGTIAVESEEGRGTAFTVRIPFGKEHLDARNVITESEAQGYASSLEQYMAEVTSTMRIPTQPAGIDPAAMQADPGVHAKRVLIADDNGDLLDYLWRILSKRYHVTCVRDGQEALEALRKEPFDVVVSDVMMPRMDGFAFLRAVRADESLRAIPFIMLSARAGPESAVEGLSAGADDYLTKPFNADDLIARIYAQIQGVALRQEAFARVTASEDRFRTLASSLPSIVLETDARGAVTFLSQTFTQFTGRPIEEGLADGWARSLHPDDAQSALDAWRERVTKGEPVELEVRVRRDDGVYRWHLIRALPQRDGDGRIVRWTGTVTDIDDRRRALDERSMLEEASRIFSQSLDLSTTLEAITRFAAGKIADWCQIDLLTPEGDIQTVAIAHRDPVKDSLAREFVGRVQLNAGTPEGAPLTLRTGKSNLVGTITPEMVASAVSDPAQQELYAKLGATSGISVPLAVDGKTVGAFSFLLSGADRKFTQDDLPLAEELGRRAAVAVQRAETFEREHRVAESFQEASLPPSLPDVSGVGFDAVYVAGSSEAQVGGDWYDAVRLLDGRLVISIGDVAGSGLSAAVTMGNMRQIIRGIAQVHADPSLMLDAADRALRLEHPQQFVTAFVGVVDPIAKTLTYASAGHPPALLRRPDASIEALSDGGLPLGLRAHQRGAHQSMSMTIEDGSLLVLYTDGLTEMNHDAIAGEAKLRDLLASDAVAASAKPAAAIKQAFLDGEAAHDDVAILAVRFDQQRAAAGAGDGQTGFHWHFDVSDVQAARSARAEFSQILSGQGATDDDRYAAELVFGELVGNVVRYAPGPIDVTLDCSVSPAVLHVMDAGPGFRHIAILPADLFSESGRGLYIVSTLTQDFHVARRPQGGSHARAVLSFNADRINRGDSRDSLLRSVLSS